MKISDHHIAAIKALGYTSDEARFLYMVATFSGYFVPRQFNAFARTKWGKRSDRFAGKLESRGHANWREHSSVGGVYHLVSKTLYRVIDRQDLRNRRRHSSEFIRRRLLLLDFVLANQACKYLETEHDKVSYFCEHLGLPRNVLPAKAYAGPSRPQPFVRYFVDAFPLFLENMADPADWCPVFSYVEAGEGSLTGFRHHLNTYQQLLAKLAGFRFLYVSDSAVHLKAAERCFAAFTSHALRDGSSGELLRYFKLRAAWDQKQYASLSNEELEWLNQANARLAGQETERLYADWCAGRLEPAVLASLEDHATPARKFRFDSWLQSSAAAIGNQSPRAG